MKVITTDLVSSVSSKFESLSDVGHSMQPVKHTYTVAMPCLVNTLPVSSEQEVVLEWADPPQTEKKKDNAYSAYDCIIRDQKKRKLAK